MFLFNSLLSLLQLLLSLLLLLLLFSRSAERSELLISLGLRLRRSLRLRRNLGDRLGLFTRRNVAFHGNCFPGPVLLGWRVRIFWFLICRIGKRYFGVSRAWQSPYLNSACLLFALLVMRVFWLVGGSGPARLLSHGSWFVAFVVGVSV